MNMAVFSQQFYFFYTVLLISIMSSLFLMMNLVYAGRPTGFSLELIHSDFLESKNLSQLERMERAFQQTKALDRRQQQLTAAASSMNSSWVSNNNNNTTGGSNDIETYYFDRYLVKIAIGSFDNNGGGRVGTLYYLSFDTASNLLWLQCVGGEHLLPQKYEYFPWQASSTFIEVPCDDHNLCPTGECYDKFAALRPCKYDIKYADKSSTTGFLAKDTLIFSPGPSGKFVNFIFGCGMSQIDFPMGQRAAGVMGFAGGGESFVSQLGLTKFEYCLLPSWTPSTDSGPTTLLRFGSETLIEGRQAVHTTPLYLGRGTVYYVTMIGISVGGTQIRYDNDELEFKSDGTGGCIFDTANTYSTLSTPVFLPLQAFLLHYYGNLTAHTPPPNTLYEICFEFPIWFEDFPEIIFHFKGGADFHIEEKAAFAMFIEFFCFNLIHRENAGISVVVGGIIQGNHRVSYDIGQRQLSWTLEDCAANP